MDNNAYKYLNNDNDGAMNDENNCIIRHREKNSLKIRLSRVFSSTNLKSPKSPGQISFNDSQNSSPIQSPITKSRYSWQTSSTPSDISLKSPNSSISDSPRTLNSPQSIWYIENGMKYSPKQQQKERKSESDAISVNATPCKTSRCISAACRCTLNRINSNDHNVISTGMFAWMRVFRMASLLPQVGC